MAVAELDALYRFAHFLTRNTEEADELVQDVYARAFRPESIEGFESRGGGMRAWLMTIARTRFYGRLEHGHARSRSLKRAARNRADERGAAEAPDPADVGGIDWEKAGPRIDAALDSLSIEHREVLWLWAVEGLKYREIGEALGVPIGTVMSRLHRARTQASRALLKDPGITDELESLGVSSRRVMTKNRSVQEG